MWVAWLNLENLYGTPDSLAHVFESALQKCEPLDVYKKLLTIYESSGKVEQAGKLYQTMIRKFGGQQWVWSHYMAFLMQRGRCEQARGVLQRALKVLKVKQDREFEMGWNSLVRERVWLIKKGMCLVREGMAGKSGCGW